MTVKELVSKLSEMDADKEVIIKSRYGDKINDGYHMAVCDHCVGGQLDEEWLWGRHVVLFNRRHDDEA